MSSVSKRRVIESADRFRERSWSRGVRGADLEEGKGASVAKELVRVIGRILGCVRQVEERKEGVVMFMFFGERTLISVLCRRCPGVQSSVGEREP